MTPYLSRSMLKIYLLLSTMLISTQGTFDTSSTDSTTTTSSTTPSTTTSSTTQSTTTSSTTASTTTSSTTPSTTTSSTTQSTTTSSSTTPSTTTSSTTSSSTTPSTTTSSTTPSTTTSSTTPSTTTSSTTPSTTTSSTTPSTTTSSTTPSTTTLSTTTASTTTPTTGSTGSQTGSTPSPGSVPPNLSACKPHCVRAHCNVQEAMFIRYYCNKECLWLYTYQAQIYSASSVLALLSTGSISSSLTISPSLTINATQLQCSGTTPPSGLNLQGCQSHCIPAQTDMAEAIFVKEDCANECLWFYGCSAQAAQGQPACGDHMLGRISAQATVLCHLVTSFCTDIAYSSAYIKARCGRTCGLC